MPGSSGTEEDSSRQLLGPIGGSSSSMPADELEYTLYDTSESAIWYAADGYGASFQIVDTDDSLEYQGTICGDAEDICDMKLKDGTYKWRLSSALLSKAHQEFIAYDFCDVRGYAGSELTFSIKGGRCRPLTMRNVSDICTPWPESQRSGVDGIVTLEGVVELVGTKADSTGKHVAIVQSALLQEFRDSLPNSHIADEDVVVSATAAQEHDNDSQYKRGRSLGVVTSQLSFSAKLPFTDLLVDVDEDIVGIDDKTLLLDEKAQTDLENDLKLYLERSMSSGMFVARILSDAKRRRVESLLDVTEASVVTLSIKRLHRENETVSILGNFIIVCGALTGLFAIYLLTERRKKGNDVVESSDTEQSKSRRTNIVMPDTIAFGTIHDILSVERQLRNTTICV